MLQKSALDILGRFVCRSDSSEFFCLLAAVAWLSLDVVAMLLRVAMMRNIAPAKLKQL